MVGVMGGVPLKITAAVGIPLLWSNRLLPALKLGMRGRTAANLAFAGGYAVLFRGRPEWFSARGWRVGLAAAGLTLAGYGVTLAVPGLRERVGEIAERVPETSHAEWVGLHIPVGTVVSEELVFRGTLTPLLDDTFGPAGTWLGATTFGLWHIYPARAAGDPIPVAIAITAAAGLFFDHLRHRTGSAAAPALLHLALNAGGALAPLLARRISEPPEILVGE